MMKVELENQFEKETGESCIDPTRSSSYSLEYTEWLEQQIVHRGESKELETLIGELASEMGRNDTMYEYRIRCIKRYNKEMVKILKTQQIIL